MKTAANLSLGKGKGNQRKRERQKERRREGGGEYAAGAIKIQKCKYPQRSRS